MPRYTAAPFATAICAPDSSQPAAAATRAPNPVRAHRDTARTNIAAMIDDGRARGLPVVAPKLRETAIRDSQVAFGRLLQNLIDNALRCGKTAELRLFHAD